MKKDRILSLTLAGALSLSLLSGCAGGQKTETPPPSEPPITLPSASQSVPPTADVLPTESVPPTEQVTPEESAVPTPSTAPADLSATPKPAATPKPTAKPVATPKPTAKPTAAPKPTTKPTATPQPTPTPAPTPTASAVSVSSIWNEIAQMELPAMMEADSEVLSSLYGIDSADLEEYVCQMPLMNVQATEFFLAKVVDGKMDAVKAAVQNRQAALEDQWSQYLPDQLELVQNYKLITNGNYILFAISYEADAAAEIFNRNTK